jgi:multidrug efflux pump subunit AcrA (membrane-fusion protein)
VTTTVSAAGTIQAQASRTLGFAANGTVTEVDVKAGDNVTAGQVLAKIDADSAQDSVDAAEDSVDAAEEAVVNAQDELDATSATPSACPSTTGQSAPRASASAAPRATATCAASSNTQRGNSSGTDALLTAQQRLNNAKLTLKQAQTKLDGTVIKAPIAGKVLSVAAGVGGQGGSSFIVLAGTTDVVVRAQFTEAEIAHLALKQTAKITLPDQTGTGYTGTVVQIDPAGTISTRLVRYGALIAFDKIPAALLYGQSANVAVTTSSVSNVLYVPSTAISDRKDDSGVVSIKVGARIERRTVTLGLRGDVNTEVKDGLAAGDEVLTSAAT